MVPLYFRTVLIVLGLIITFVGSIYSAQESDPRGLFFSLAGAVVAALSAFAGINLTAPDIKFNSDRTAVVIEADAGSSIRYRVGNGDWIKYDTPFPVSADTMVSAQSSYARVNTSEISTRDIDVDADTGLLYFDNESHDPMDSSEDSIGTISEADAIVDSATESESATTSATEEHKVSDGEPNEDYPSATEVEVNKVYTGSLSSRDDVDYYKIELESKGKLSITFKHELSKVDKAPWKIWAYDSNGKGITEIISKWQDLEYTTSNFRVPAGIYYVVISAFDYSDAEYTFQVNYSAEGDEAETEPNDDFDEATPINLGSSITGNLQEGGDEDFYVFDFTGGNLKLTFSHDMRDTDGYLWSYHLIDASSGEEIKPDGLYGGGYSEGDEESRTDTWSNLAASTYYIKVEKVQLVATNLDYHIAIENG